MQKAIHQYKKLMHHTLLKLHKNDNVAVALQAINIGEKPQSFDFIAQENIPNGHKTAIKPIKMGDNIIKYGQIIGAATQDINIGAHVHTHNVSMSLHYRDYQSGKNIQKTDYLLENERAVFQGYKRPDGKIGTRNYVGIITSVNCSASAAKMIALEAEKRGLLEKYPHVDGIVPITHGTGCGVANDSEPIAKLQRVIWGYAMHPNFASVMMLGLGCESNQISFILDAYGMPLQKEKFNYYTIQQLGGTRKTVEQGLIWLEAALQYANEQKRESVSASHITLALQCGGSDGYSGITANPALGYAADLLVKNGGTAVLAETPEIYGAEHLLVERAETAETGEKLIDLINWWEDYTQKHDGAMNNNPSPGNKAGGLTTILEKSLGAVAKGGTTNLTAVYKYGEIITKKGFVFMDSPGYDPVSITGEVASGCNVICFTTGRGSCYGNKPSPSIKIASNTKMYQHMIEDMDINAGTIIDGEETLEDVGKKIFDEILDVASGKRTLSEQLNIGDAEFVPWQTYAQM